MSMSGSFANASHFVISNSTFTHVSGNQHNYNFSGQPSASSYDAAARFVLAVDNSKYTTENSSSSQQSEVYIHELRKPTDATAASQASSSTTSSHIQSVGSNFGESRAGSHLPQPSFICRPVAPPLPAQFSRAKTSPPSSVPAPHSSRDGFIQQESDAGIDRLSRTETWLPSRYRVSSPSGEAETEAIPSHSTTSGIGSSSSPAPLRVSTNVRLRAPSQPVSSHQYNCRDNVGAVRSTQAQPPPPPEHHAPPQHPYETQTPSVHSNPKPRPSYDAHRRQMSDSMPYPAWFEENKMVQSPLPPKNQQLESRHLSHPATPRRTYHSYPPANPYTQNFDPHAQLRRESHMLWQESQTWSYYHNDHSS
ncbi:hypothetical protein D9756_010846 [Leucocoprinus leucothites]|uniref:Uncharacterized protein n=1 Tax=Leucocoprinus leucothites TaxID=201217 RepID=A0A8H5FQN5_9AGAR|nr:hypothetical protein D9756_010846 [Leucoagaricus leucothites]